MSHIQTLERCFKLGATILRDIDPSWPVEKVLAAYTPNYPFLAQATVNPPVVENDRLVYEIVRPAAQTKGTRRAREAGVDEAVLESLRSWLDAPGEQAAIARRWEGVHTFLLQPATRTNEMAFLAPQLIPLS